MKRLIFCGAFVLSLLATSCSSDNDAEKPVVVGKQISITANIKDDGNLRVVYDDNGSSKMKASWSTNEKFLLYKGLYGSSSEFSKNKQGDIFTGVAPTEGTGNYYALYGTDDEGNNLLISDASTSIDISKQVGTNKENGIKEVMVAEATNLTSTFQFKHLLAVLKLTLTLPSSLSGKADKVAISGMYSNAQYSWSEKKFDYDDYNGKKDIEATNNGAGFEISEAHTITAYIAVFPQHVEANSVIVKVTVGNDIYTYTMAKENTLVAGKVVPVQVAVTNMKIFSQSEYYQWDACKSYNLGNSNAVSDEFPWGTSTPWFNPTTGVATVSCKNCITKDEMEKYLNAGVIYWDSGCGTVADGLQTYQAATSIYDNSYGTAHSGLWLLKKSKWPENITGSLKSIDNVSKISDLSTVEVKQIRTGGDYFFLPAVGIFDSYNNNGVNMEIGTWGYYWLSEASSPLTAYCLVISEGNVRYETLNKYHGYVPLILSDDGTLESGNTITKADALEGLKYDSAIQ